MDNSAVQPQGSISSISTSDQALDLHDVALSATAPSEFVNHGLLLWNQTRQQWRGVKKSEDQPRQVKEPKLSCLGFSMVTQLWPCSWNASYGKFLRHDKPFPRPIPLPEMIDLLTDTWEQEGLMYLYD